MFYASRKIEFLLTAVALFLFIVILLDLPLYIAYKTTKVQDT